MKVAVIGCGAQGRGGHVANYNKINDIDLVAVCDVNFEQAQAVAMEFGIPYVYSDYRELLDKHNLDLVSVCTPHAFHRDQTVDAFEAGANVICEKALAVSSIEAAEMIAACKWHKKKMSMGLQNRGSAEGRILKQFIDEGGLGKIYYTRVVAGHVMDIPGYSVFHKKSLSGGGVFYSTAVHNLDLANWIIGDPTPVAAMGTIYQKVRHMKNPLISWKGTLGDFETEDFAAGYIRFENDSGLSIESNWLTHPWKVRPQIEILGDYGTAEIPLKIYVDQGNQVFDRTPKITESGNHFFEVLKDFVDAVREDRTPIVKFSQMLHVQQMMEGIYQSAETRKEVLIGK